MRSWMIGIVLGMLPVALCSTLPRWPVPLFLLAGAALALYWRSWRTRLCAGVALGCAVALLHGDALLQRRLDTDCVLLPLMVTGRVSSLPRTSLMRDSSTRQRFEFSLESLRPEHCGGPARLLLSYYGPYRIIPGERWRFVVKLKRPWGLANPGSFNMQAWFARTGIDAVGSVRAGSAQSLPASGPWTALHHRLRLTVSEHIGALALPADVTAILRALTVADKSGIDNRLWSLLQLFGINHLLVISGLHVGLVAGAGYLLGGALSRLVLLAGSNAPWLPGALALVLACAYTALAGFSLATQRALCMLACFIIASLLRRGSGAANNLLLAALLVLCLNPLAALGSGFWLSFGAVAALLWLACWQRGAGIARRMCATHVFMSLVMLPMGAWWFGGSSVVAALANFMMIPVVGFAVVPLALLATLAYLLGWPVAQLLWHWAAWPVQQLLPLAFDLAAGGQHWLYRHFTASPAAVLLAVTGVLLLVLPRARSLKAMALLMILPLLLPASQLRESTSLRTRVTVLDVGQGTAVVIWAGHRALLYDTGGGDPAGANMASSVVLPYLRSQGISALDTFVVSHPDTDHSAGTLTVLQALPVSRFRYGAPLPGVTGGRPCVAGQTWRWPGGQVFRFLSPALESGLARNDSSCVLQLEIGPYHLLLPGDIESARERALVRYWREGLRSDWLLLAHHGSATSTSETLLKTVRPQVVVISSGYANRFGHPHADVIQRLGQRGATVFSTAAGGALEFDFVPGRAPAVSVFRRQRLRFWM